MKTYLSAALCVVALVLIAGCSSSSDSVSQEFEPVNDETGAKETNTPTAVTATTSNEQSPALRPTFADAQPNEIVRDFIEALQNGDRVVAENLLTDKARYETKRADLDVRPVASPAATYKVGATKFATQRKEVAHVDSLWTEKTDDGLQASFSITWVVRRQANETWRVAGMLTPPAEGLSPIFLNFENPVEMMAKADAVETGDIDDGSSIKQASFNEPIDE